MKVPFKALIVASSLFVGSVIPSVAQDVAAGMKYLDAEQLNKAKETFVSVGASPGAENQFYLGYYYLRVGQLALKNEKVAEAKAAASEAKAAFEKSIAADPKFALGYVGLGGAALLTKDLSGGKAQINKALEMTKNKDEKVLYRAAEMYVLFDDENASNDPAEAIRLIDAIGLLKKKTNDPEYLVVKGDAFNIKNEGGPAVSEYEKANTITPQAKNFNKIGKIFKRGKNYSFAQEGFKKAVETDSLFAPQYREFGELWLLARNYKNAAFNYKRYIEVLEKGDPRDVTPEILLRYAKFAFLSKDFDNATKALARVEGKIQDNDILRMKGYIANNKEQHEVAVENLEKLLKVLPENKRLMLDYGLLARSYQKLKKSDEALGYFQKALADTVENYQNDIANVYFFDKKDYKMAAENYEKALQWKNDHKERASTNDYLNIGRSYYFAASGAKTAKDTANVVAYAPKADAAFAKIPEINPNYAMVHVWRGRSCSLAQIKDAAQGLEVPHYEKFLEVGDKEKNKNEMLEACKVLAVNQLVYKKDNAKALEYANKGLTFKADDKQLMDLIATVNGTTTTPAPGTPPNAPAPAPAPAPKN